MNDSKACLIPLTQGYFATVDADDYERLSGYKWQVVKDGNTFYACRKEKGRMIKMHRDILKAPDGMECDHINHNPDVSGDNRKCNLRLCTHQQNCFNKKPLPNCTSKYKGVSWSVESKKWRAEIMHNGRTIHIGCFDYEQDAAIAYDDKAIELFGEFAYLNHQHRPEIQQWLKDTRLWKQNAALQSIVASRIQSNHCL